jgi:hypothetical protein
MSQIGHRVPVALLAEACGWCQLASSMGATVPVVFLRAKYQQEEEGHDRGCRAPMERL